MDAGLCGFLFTAAGVSLILLLIGIGRSLPCRNGNQRKGRSRVDVGTKVRSLIHGDGPKPAPNGAAAAGGDTTAANPT